ncbi:GntR family transcriptional regulator [uncultured Sphaerochaeta sp.]|uniref:GntR family transcriptional regulator n=1 Tax=uncultured Sphaerochaeta sp. TaxID=886478 RepID=UPI002A0A2EA7|nr:GntR family transcriptional regulator [uncultured Sphaerochaeta sp.]
MNKKVPLYIQAKQYLENEIASMPPHGNQLESEPVLTKKLKMSRGTIRKALTELYREGLISKWRGKGSFGHPAVARLPMRFDVDSNFRLLLEHSGYRVHLTRSAWRETFGTEEMELRIPGARERSYVTFDQDFFADDSLAIHTTVCIDMGFIKVYPEPGEYHDNINKFFLTHCKMKSEHVISWQRAETNPLIASSFGLPPETPLLCWQEVYYNVYDECMGYIKINFNPGIMDLSMLLHFS